MTIQILGIIILAESLILIGLTLFGRLTRKIFLLFAGLTILISAYMLYANKSSVSDASTDERKSIYMAARLLEEGKEDQAVNVLGAVDDETAGEYLIVPVRGAAYNLNEAFQLAVVYLENTDDPMAEAVLQASQKEERLGPDQVKEIVSEAIGALGLSEEERASFESELSRRFLSERGESDDSAAELSDIHAAIRQKLNRKEYEEAYETAEKVAARGTLEDDIILSQLFANGYDSGSLMDADEEMDHLLAELTEREASSVEKRQTYLKEEENRKDTQDHTEDRPDDYKESSYAAAQYSISLKQLQKEKTGRAINYLNNAAGENGKQEQGYMWQMAYLYFMNEDYESAERFLDRVFMASEGQDGDPLIRLTNELKLAFFLSQNQTDDSDYDTAFENLISNLYSNAIPLDDLTGYDEFKQYVSDFLFERFGSIRILDIDTSAHPSISARINMPSGETGLSKEMIRLKDTGMEITDFNIQKDENRKISICYVLDISGSMTGEKLASAKSAVSDSISGLAEGTQAALVTFNHEAFISCGLTEEKGIIAGILYSMNASGGTNISAGLRMACEALRNADGDRVIILVSDGYDQYPGDLNDALAEVDIINASVYTIGLEGSDENYLAQISGRSGGAFASVQNSAELQKIYDRFQKIINESITVSYTVENPEEDNRYIQIEHLETTAIGRKNYRLYKEWTSQNSTAGVLQESDFFRQIGGTERLSDE